jgi:redox-sensing transcriptional repressor
MNPKLVIPKPSLRRLPVYYRRLRQAIAEEAQYVSSEDLGASAGVPGAQVRKDLSFLAEFGRAGVGYPARALAAQLEDYLGLLNDKEAVLVGVGNLGRALALYSGFRSYGLQIIALFDSDPAKCGELEDGRQIFPVEKLADLVRRLQVRIGIITVPDCAAQEIAEAMLAGGIKVIWNFAPCRLCVPEDVYVKNEDLAAELATLSHHITQEKIAVVEA